MPDETDYERNIRIITEAFKKDMEERFARIVTELDVETARNKSTMSRMNLKCLFIQRNERYEGEFAPEFVLAWDEYAIDDNPEGFEQDVEINLKQLKQEIMGHAIVTIEVDQDTIRKLCINDTPPVIGNIKE